MSTQHWHREPLGRDAAAIRHLGVTILRNPSVDFLDYLSPQDLAGGPARAGMGAILEGFPPSRRSALLVAAGVTRRVACRA